MTTPQIVLEEVGADNSAYCVISNADNECCTTQQLPPLPELPPFDGLPTTVEGTTFASSTSDLYSTADVARHFTTRVTTLDHDGSALSPGPITVPNESSVRTTGDDQTLIIVLSCVGFICLAFVACVISCYVYHYYMKKKQRSLTVTPANGQSPSPAAERRSGTFHNPDENFVELYPATKPAWEGNDNDGYQSEPEVMGNNVNGDSGVVVSPKPEKNGTEETNDDNKPKKKKKKKKKAPDLNVSLIERQPPEPTEVIT